MSKSPEDYYKLLGVEKSVTPEELKKAYRKKAVQFHPDTNKGDKGAEEKFKQISEAYEVLQDPQKKAAYDRFGHAAFQGGAGGGRSGGTRGAGGQDPFDIFRDVFSSQGGSGGIFEEFFKGGFSDGSANQGEPGNDLRSDIEITLEEVAKGVEREISYRARKACSDCTGTGEESGSKRKTCTECKGNGYVVSGRGFISVRQPCVTCQGTGSCPEKPCKSCRGDGRVIETCKLKVKIPAGIDDGSQLRSTGSGDVGLRGGFSGDLYIVIHVKAHAIFERHGDDLYCKMPIQFALATLGGSIEVPTLDTKASLKIPAGTQSGTVFKIKGYGISGRRKKELGDLLVHIEIAVPKTLTDEQREKLEAFATACGDVPESPEDKSFFDKLKRTFN